METALSNVTPCDLLRVVHRHQGSPEDLVTVVFDDIGADDWATGEGFSATQTGRPRVAHLQTGYLSVGLPRFELGTFGPPDHRNLSETSVWTASARGYNDVCLTGGSVSVWWCAFCAMKCATRRAGLSRHG